MADNFGKGAGLALGRGVAFAGDLIAEYLDKLETFTPERYPVRNHESRVPLDPRLWHLIHERDGGVCWVCEQQVLKGQGEIDHLIPRSSFESHELSTVADRSWNLRLACERCNQEKSNFTMMFLPRTVGVTLRCWDCSNSSERTELQERAYCGACGFTSAVPGKEWIL